MCRLLQTVLAAEGRLPAPLGDRLLSNLQRFSDGLGCVPSIGHQGDTRTQHLPLGAHPLPDDGLQVVPLLLGERDRMSRAPAYHPCSMLAQLDKHMLFNELNCVVVHEVKAGLIGWPVLHRPVFIFGNRTKPLHRDPGNLSSSLL